MDINGYVSYKVAELLNKKGYNDISCVWYITEDEKSFGLKKGEISFCSHSIDGKSITINAPHLWEAQKWLRDKYKIAVCPTPYDYHWNYIIYDLKMTIDYNHKIISSRVNWDSYEEALDEGIYEALKNI